MYNFSVMTSFVFFHLRNKNMTFTKDANLYITQTSLYFMRYIAI